MKSTYSEPTTLRRLRHPDGREAHAVIVPRWHDASAVWFVDGQPEQVKDFEDWNGARKWLDSIRDHLSGHGWNCRVCRHPPTRSPAVPRVPASAGDWPPRVRAPLTNTPRVSSEPAGSAQGPLVSADQLARRVKNGLIEKGIGYGQRVPAWPSEITLLSIAALRQEPPSGLSSV